MTAHWRAGLKPRQFVIRLVLQQEFSFRVIFFWGGVQINAFLSRDIGYITMGTINVLA